MKDTFERASVVILVLMLILGIIFLSIGIFTILGIILMVIPLFIVIIIPEGDDYPD